MQNTVRKSIHLEEKHRLGDLSPEHMTTSSMKASGGLLPMKDNANVEMKCFQDQ